MAFESEAIVVLDEGNEESLENLASCCKTGPTKPTY
ncbi:MAG TPA: geopeptide [Geobacteraceae bacterium]|nr:geopeptide [Geobacteraceae bacterium]